MSSPRQKYNWRKDRAERAFHERVASRIRHRRVMAIKTQAECAVELGITRAAFTTMEAARVRFSLWQCAVLADFFDVSLATIVGHGTHS